MNNKNIQSEETSLNNFKTELIMNLFAWMVKFKINWSLISDVVNKIVSCNNADELFDLDIALEKDDKILEKILKKCKIDRTIVVKDKQIKIKEILQN